MNCSLIRKLWGGLSVLTILGIGFLFVGEPFLESRKANQIEMYLSSLPGNFKAERIAADLYSGAFTIHNLTGTLKNADGSESAISILAIEGEDLGTGAPGTPLIKHGQITRLTVTTTAALIGTAEPRKVTVENAGFDDLEGVVSTDKGLPFLLGAFSVGEFNIFAFSDSVLTVKGTVTVEAQSLDFKADEKGRGTLAGLGALMLPDILKAQAVSEPERQAVHQAWKEFTASGGTLTLSLRSDRPFSMQQLERTAGGELHVAASLTPSAQ